MATIQQLKALYGTDSDDEAIGKAAKEFGIPAVEIAREVGVKPGGMWSNRFGGAIDSYQANLYDVAEHVTKGLGLDTASKWLGQRREANKSQAETSGMYAREQGAVDSFFDQTDANGNVTSRGVHGFGDAANWFGGLAAQSFPYLFEAAAGGVAGRALAGGAKLGLQLGKELGMPTVVEAASNSATRASIAGSVAASYPSSVGDILSNQREQIEANGGQGETNFGSALLGGVPHAALNAFDPSHRLAATGKFFKAPVDWFDNIPGWRGNAARMGATALAKGGEEGLNETGQELINQRFGRMAVDPNATMTSGDAMSRYLESFVGGAALGGVMGGAGGGWRRSEHYKPQTPPADPTPGASTDLLNTPPAAPPQLGWNGYHNPGQGQTPFHVFPDGSTATTGDMELMQRYGMTPGELGGFRAGGDRFDASTGRPVSMADVAGPAPGAPAAPQFDPRFAGFGNVDPTAVGLSPFHDQALTPNPAGGERVGPVAAPVWDSRTQSYTYDTTGGKRLTGQFDPTQGFPHDIALPDTPGVITADQFGAASGNADALYGRDNGDPGLALARQRYAEQLAQQNQIKQTAAAVQEKAQRDREDIARAATLVGGRPDAKIGDKAVGLVLQLEEQRDAGLIDEATFVSDVAALSNHKYGQVAKAIKERDSARNAAGAGAAGSADVGRGAGSGVAPAQPGNVQPAAQQPAAQAVSRPGADGVRPGVAGRGDALKQAVTTVDETTGAKKTVLPYVAPPTRQAHQEESHEQAAFRRTFGDRFASLDRGARDLLERWLGIEVGADGDLQLTGTNESYRKIAQTEGVSHETVRERIVQALRDAGAPEGVSPKQLFKRLGLDLSGFDAETLDRLTRQETEDVAGFDQHFDQASVKEDASALGGVGDASVETERGGPGEDAYKQLVPEMPDQDPTGRTNRDEGGPIDESSSAESRAELAEQERDLSLRGILADELADGRVTADDVRETVVFYETNRTKGMRPWASLAPSDQAAYTRVYARARLAGDPQVLQTKKAIYEQETTGAVRGVADAHAAEAEGRRAEERGVDGAQAGDVRDQQNRPQVQGSGGGQPAVVVKRKRRAVRPDEDVGVQKSRDTRGGADLFHDKDSLEDSLLSFINADEMGRRVTVVDTAADLEDATDVLAAYDDSAVAWTRDGKAILIADRIAVGKERGVFMHEVGSHLGLERMLKPEEFHRLADKIVSWSTKDDGSLESKIAKAARERVEQAGTEGAEERKAELVAYFVEEAVNAGVDPTALKYNTELGRWMRSVWAAFKSALRKLGVKIDKLTAQDVVDLAYGMARINVTGRFHGTAADVHQFRSKFMGTGEGAQMYGWGHYFSELRGVATEYRDSDVKRKNRLAGVPRMKAVFALAFGGAGPDSHGIFEREGVQDKRYGVTENSEVRVRAGVPYVEVQSTLVRTPEGWKKRIPGKDWVALDQLVRPADGQRAFSDAELSEIADIVSTAFGQRVDGNLYATDLAVKAHELLDWTKSITDQPEAMREFLAKHDDLYRDFTASDYEKTGGGFYHYLVDQLKDGEHAPSANHVDPERQRFHDDMAAKYGEDWRNAKLSDDDREQLRRMEHPPRRASLYLDSHGVKGVQMPVGHMSGGTYETGRNFVVFDQKNIIRAVNNPANRVSKSVQFSRAEGADSQAVSRLNDLRQAINDTMPSAARDRVTNLRDAWAKYSPYLLSNFQLMEKFGGKGPGKLESLKDHLRLTDLMTQEATRQQMQYDEVAKRWVRLPDAAKTLLHDIMQRATLNRIHPDKALTDEANAHLTTEQKAEYPRLRQDWERLGRTWPAATKVYADALAVEDRAWQSRVDALEALTKRYGIAYATPKRTPGPYFPLVRFGDYLAVAKSKEFLELEDQILSVEKDDPVTRKEANKILDEMRADPKHYQVSAHETRAAADRALAGYRQQGYEKVYSAMKDQHLNALPKNMHATIAQLAAGLSKDFAPEQVGEMTKVLGQVMLQSLPEARAVMEDAARKGVAGASPDMLRAFAAKGRTDAFATSRLLYAKDLAANMQAMKAEAQEGGYDLQHVHREIEKRVALNMQFHDTPIQNAVNSVSWAYHLGMSPAFLFMNMTQPWLVSGPVLAGRFGLAKATAALGKASREAIAVLKDARFKDGKWDAWAGIHEDSVPEGRMTRNAEGKMVSEDRKALRELMQRGIVDEGLNHEMSAFSSGYGKLEQARKVMGWASQQVELVNRTATALAAFRLARDGGMDYNDAVEYAYRTSVQTQIDYSAEGAPRFMRSGGGIPLAKMMFQFRRYQQAMAMLLLGNLKKSFGSGKEAEVARATLGYFGITTLMTAGVMGLPGFTAAAFLLGLGDDDDDERGDLKTRLRNYLVDMTGDKAMADALAKGLPTLMGADLSGRIGMGDVFSLYPRLDLSTARSVDEKMGRVAAAVMGPGVGGLGAQAFRAGQFFEQGDWAKGTEQLVPKMAADVIQAGRTATKGMTDMKGEQILGADEISAWDTTLRALGVSPQDQANYYEANAAINKVKRATADRKAQIHNQYRAALHDGDMSDVRALIDKFNEDHPQSPIKPKDELAWRKDARKQESMRGLDGIKLDPKRDRQYRDLVRFAQ